MFCVHSALKSENTINKKDSLLVGLLDWDYTLTSIGNTSLRKHLGHAVMVCSRQATTVIKLERFSLRPINHSSLMKNLNVTGVQ